MRNLKKILVLSCIVFLLGMSSCAFNNGRYSVQYVDHKYMKVDTRSGRVWLYKSVKQEDGSYSHIWRELLADEREK